jgi:hypothetical protein
MMPKIAKRPKDEGKPVWVTIERGWQKPKSFVVGHVKDGVFVKTVVGSKHFLKEPPAIAIDVQSLNDAKALGATDIHIYDKETRTHYFTSMLILEKDGRTLDRGYGVQLYLPFGLWNEMTEEQYRKGRDEPYQASLL